MRLLHPFVALVLASGGVAACTADAAGPGPRPGEATATADRGNDATVVTRRGCGAGETALSRRMSSGATWAMCVHVEAKRGLVLTDVTLAAPGAGPVSIAHEIALAQLEVPYDTGARLTDDITSAGFGGVKMQDLGGTECTGERIGLPVATIGDGTAFGETPTRPVLCSEIADAGVAYRSLQDNRLVTARRDAWSLTTISKVGWYEYLARYTFGADGSISPDLGATGDLSPVDYIASAKLGALVSAHDRAASHAHNAVWRVHWALGGGPLAVDQYDARPTGATGPESPILEGGLTRLTTAGTAAQADRRWWQVSSTRTRNSDGHPIGYQVDLGATDSFTFAGDASRGVHAGYDIAFTNDDPCELYATGNRASCGDGVPDYVAGDTSPLADVVSWIAVGFHHVPRDEDQSPMEVHWQGFRLTPRNLTAMRLDVPHERRKSNGQPETYEGEPLTSLEADSGY